jgi:hypothetical protein
VGETQAADYTASPRRRTHAERPRKFMQMK